jgi:hypothetical protein
METWQMSRVSQVEHPKYLSPHNQFKTVQSATRVISKYKTPRPITGMITIENHNCNVYPHILKKRELVDELQQKLLIDIQREFEGQSDDQKQVLNRLIEKTARTRQRGGLDPGVCEKIQNELFDQFLANERVEKVSEKYKETGIVIETSQDHDDQSDDTDDLFDLEYPIQDSYLESSTPVEKLLDQRAIQETIQLRKKTMDQKMTLKQCYGQMVDSNTLKGQQFSSKTDLEQEAVQAMKSGNFFLNSYPRFTKLGYQCIGSIHSIGSKSFGQCS